MSEQPVPIVGDDRQPGEQKRAFVPRRSYSPKANNMQQHDPDYSHDHWANDPARSLTDEQLRLLHGQAHDVCPECPEHLHPPYEGADPTGGSAASGGARRRASTSTSTSTPRGVAPSPRHQRLAVLYMWLGQEQQAAARPHLTKPRLGLCGAHS